ncbi:MAG: hypothetical protein KDI46_03450 [Alphaproteobacteria bacterium]|nr:hypothetical protein [Alphaproteobacteria bacterium]
MNTQSQAIKQESSTPILPGDQTRALNTLIKATRDLVDLADKEAQALAVNDMMAFNILQEEKTFLVKRYEKLAGEFRGRLEEFRGVDRGLLDRLENLQNLLGEKTLNNNIAVSNVYDNAKNKTQSSLISAQEMGQRMRDEDKK